MMENKTLTLSSKQIIGLQISKPEVRSDFEASQNSADFILHGCY